jgi:hypothetical protein
LWKPLPSRVSGNDFIVEVGEDVHEAGYIKKFNPNFEADVQWNVIQTTKLLGSLIYIRNAKGQEFHLDKITGKIQAR